MRQLEIFHQASFKVTKRDKETRMFYLERVMNEVMSASAKPCIYPALSTYSVRRWRRCD